MLKKTTHLPVAAFGFMLAAFASPALAATLPVSEDTTSVPPGKIDKRAGNSSTLAVSPNATAFVRFDAGDFSGLVKPTDVTSARLTFYITDVAKAGKIGIHRVTSEWTESPAAPRAAPSFDPQPIATIAPKAVRAGQFAVIDVTDQVKKWLAEPQSDRGFAITGAGEASIQIRAKEGSAAGMPASLEIDNHPVINNKQLADGINATKLGNGVVSNAEFAQLNGVTAPLQQQIDGLKTGTGNLGGAVETLQTGLAAVEGEVDALQAGVVELETRNGGLTESIAGLGGDLVDLEKRMQDADTYIYGQKFDRTGGYMSGPLTLPPNGLTVGKDINVANGNLGVGVFNPEAKLDVNGNAKVKGDIKLGPNADLNATAGGEKLRIIRGTFKWDGTTETVEAGSGFTFVKNQAGHLEVTFAQPFSGIPTVVVSGGYPDQPNQAGLGATASASATGAMINGMDSFPGGRTHFIAIGPR